MNQNIPLLSTGDGSASPKTNRRNHTYIKHNQAGKEILIKSMITAIPTYVMSIFKLPKTWCAEINTMIADFWWVRTNEGRKIHWRRWKILIKTKNVRGLGFRELDTFNMALLVKMAKRIIDELNAL